METLSFISMIAEAGTDVPNADSLLEWIKAAAYLLGFIALYRKVTSREPTHVEGKVEVSPRQNQASEADFKDLKEQFKSLKVDVDQSLRDSAAERLLHREETRSDTNGIHTKLNRYVTELAEIKGSQKETNKLLGKLLDQQINKS